MKIKQTFQRKGFTLSAFFLFFLIVLATSACKKPETKLGAEVYDPNELLDANGVDTFQLTTYCVIEDSALTTSPSSLLLGSYNDPVFGQVSASFFAQFRIEENAPDFGDLTTIKIDSVVLCLDFLDYYGDVTAPQTYEVYALNEGLDVNTNYFAFSSLDTLSGTMVVPGRETIKPNLGSEVIVFNDTLEPQLRIALDTNYAHSIFNAPSSDLVDNTAFLSVFKGLLVKTNNGFWSSGDGSLISIDAASPNTKIVIYYHQAGEPLEFNLILSDESAYFNRVKFDNSGAKVQVVLNDSTQGQLEFYTQANIIKAKVDFPSVSNLGIKTVISRATLYLPVSYYSQSEFYPSPILKATTLFDGYGEVGVTTAQFNTSTKRYIFNITNYIQSIVGENYENNGLLIYPDPFGGSVERVIFNGVNSPNKDKPKLVITYTEF